MTHQCHHAKLCGSLYAVEQADLWLAHQHRLAAWSEMCFDVSEAEKAADCAVTASCRTAVLPSAWAWTAVPCE